jgi:hypothetical protein
MELYLYRVAIEVETHTQHAEIRRTWNLSFQMEGYLYTSTWTNIAVVKLCKLSRRRNHDETKKLTTTDREQSWF